jgi:hypothetical protein
MTLLAWVIAACLMTFGVGFLVATYGANVGLADAPQRAGAAAIQR